VEFSVIVPTYMEEECIENCLRSIEGQRYHRSEFEIIVSDARSTDRTVELAHRYTDNIIVEDRKGIAFGRNCGAKKAKGDILVFIDADAILDENFLIHCHKTFMDPTVAGMTGIANPSDGGALQKFVYHGTYWMVRLFYFFGLSLFPGICVAYKRDVFLSHGGFREDFGIVEDLDLSRRIAHTGTCLINTAAVAAVSTRRLENHLVSTVCFHIYCDLKYLITGHAPARYLKTEEVRSWHDLWR
jgi:glycosyltransferase involved in cell wall biosynthesis